MLGWSLILTLGRLFLGAGNLIKLGVTTGVSLFVALPNWAKLLIAIAVSGVIVYYVGDLKGAARVQSKWDAAQATAIEKAHEAGSKANADAENSIPLLAPAARASDADIVPRGKPCVVRDRFDRSCAR